MRALCQTDSALGTSHTPALQLGAPPALRGSNSPCHARYAPAGLAAGPPHVPLLQRVMDTYDSAVPLPPQQRAQVETVCHTAVDYAPLVSSSNPHRIGTLRQPDSPPNSTKVTNAHVVSIAQTCPLVVKHSDSRHQERQIARATQHKQTAASEPDALTSRHVAARGRAGMQGRLREHKHRHITRLSLRDTRSSRLLDAACHINAMAAPLKACRHAVRLGSGTRLYMCEAWVPTLQCYSPSAGPSASQSAVRRPHENYIRVSMMPPQVPRARAQHAHGPSVLIWTRVRTHGNYEVSASGRWLTANHATGSHLAAASPPSEAPFPAAASAAAASASACSSADRLAATTPGAPLVARYSSTADRLERSMAMTLAGSGPRPSGTCATTTPGQDMARLLSERWCSPTRSGTPAPVLSHPYPVGTPGQAHARVPPCLAKVGAAHGPQAHLHAHDVALVGVRHARVLGVEAARHHAAYNERGVEAPVGHSLVYQVVQDAPAAATGGGGSGVR
mgnify:CR=1 FL=1